MPIKSYQSTIAADLGTSCFHSAVLPAVSLANSIITHVLFALWPPLAVRLAAPASLSVNTAVCISTPVC